MSAHLLKPILAQLAKIANEVERAPAEPDGPKQAAAEAAIGRCVAEGPDIPTSERTAQLARSVSLMQDMYHK